MKRKVINTQMSNFKTYEMYKRKYLALAKNVYQFKNLPTYIPKGYLNSELLIKGSIAFFMDEELGLLALPYNIIGTRDVYDRPRQIEVIGFNGYHKVLTQDEFVIMYDNTELVPIYLDVLQYAERISHATRVCDINLEQQKTPRIFKCKNGKEVSLERVLRNIDSNANSIVSYDDNLVDDIETCLMPAPYVADKVSEYKDKLYNEFLTLIGISNVSFEKKERQIKDEIEAQQGGTIASRYSRFTPRLDAVEKINEKWGLNIEVYYYDGLPESKEDFKEGEDNVQ